jgi:hypothetical protein
MSALQDAIKEAYTLAPSDVVIYDTLEIRQGEDSDEVQPPVFLVRGALGITALDENGVSHDYLPIGFQFSLPPSTEDGFESLNIAIDNIGQAVSDFVAVAMSQEIPVKVIYRPYLSNDLTTPQMIPPLTLFLKDIQISAEQVTGRATFMDIVNKKFPLGLYTRTRFPTLG